jgi:hypothetical protein
MAVFGLLRCIYILSTGRRSIHTVQSPPVKRARTALVRLLLDFSINVGRERRRPVSALLQHDRSQGPTCSRSHVWKGTALPGMRVRWMESRHVA